MEAERPGRDSAVCEIITTDTQYSSTVSPIAVTGPMVYL